MTISNKLILKKHKYDKREYIIFLLKKNFILNENENYKTIVNEILEKMILILIQNLLRIIAMMDF